MQVSSYYLANVHFGSVSFKTSHKDVAMANGAWGENPSQLHRRQISQHMEILLSYINIRENCISNPFNRMSSCVVSSLNVVSVFCDSREEFPIGIWLLKLNFTTSLKKQYKTHKQTNTHLKLFCLHKMQ